MTARLQVQVAEAPVIELLAEVLDADLKTEIRINICPDHSKNHGVLLLFHMGLVKSNTTHRTIIVFSG